MISMCTVILLLKMLYICSLVYIVYDMLNYKMIIIYIYIYIFIHNISKSEVGFSKFLRLNRGCLSNRSQMFED